MACAQQCAAEYLRNCRRNLVTQMRNLPLIIENLYQQKVFNDHEVDALKAERTEFDKARSILDWVINKGETACYELLRILDATQKRTLDSDLHYWICCFPFRVEDTEISYSTGTKPCQNYQKKLKNKAKNILKDQREHCGKYLGDEGQVNFHFISLVLETDSEGKTPQCKIKWKNKKCKKLRPKKLRAYIPNEEQALSPVDLLRCQDKNILLIGKPGIGKTTVVQEIMRLWAEKDDREFYYMFYFDESVLAHSSRVVNLESIFFDVYLKPKEKDRKDVFQDIEENSENVVIVFDGVVDLEENSTLRKIMKHELLPDAKIIITCRSEVEYDPLFSSWPTRKVYVQGFSEKSISTYYQSMLGHDSVLLDDVLKNQELFSLSHVPMYAFMIVDLIQFKNDNVYNHLHTVTEMYIHIFRVAVKKHGKKKIEEIDMYLKEIKDQIHLLMKNAFSATMQKCLNLPDISSVKKDICHAFLKMITTRDSPTSATTYCAFLHNTMQEFFSALWLLGNPGETEKVLHLCQTEENKHMRHVLPFLCGLLGEHNINLIKCLFPEDQIKKTSDWFIEKFLDTFLQPQSESEVVDLLYVCQCLYELQSPKACLMFLEKMDHQLEPEGDLDPHQCCALSYVIGQSRDKEVYLNLEDCNMTDTGMKMMLRCSPKIRLKIWEDPLKQITFFLEFFHKVSQCSCSFFDLRPRNKPELCDALLDLCSHVKNYETQTGWSFLPVLQSVFQSPDVWIIDLSQRKTSVLLEVLKLQTEKKPVELRGCSEEESEMKSFLQCLPYISQLRFSNLSKSVQNRFLLRLFIKAAETETQTGQQMMKMLTSVCVYRSFPYGETDRIKQSDFLLDLYSHVKNYETQTGRSFLPALQSVFQLPKVWIIDLSERKTSVLLEVLKLQTEKKPVELRRCSEEESEMMSFLQCLPYISQLRIDYQNRGQAEQFVLKLFIKAGETETQTGEQMLKLLTSVYTYRSFPYEETDRIKQSDLLLDLYSHVKNYETQTGSSFLPALQSVFQSPDVWIIDLSQRKTSVLLEVLKLQTEKKPVELRRCSEEESEMMSFLQCLPYISQLRFSSLRKSVQMQFLLKLFIKAAETETQTGEQMMKLLTSVCTYRSFPYGETDGIKQRDFLLGLYSHVNNYKTQTGRSFLPALQSVFQSPDVWIIDLSQRKTSVLLEVLKLQTEKKPVDLRGCSEEESEIMSFLQCLPYISQLRFSSRSESVHMDFVLKLFIKAAETETQTGEQMLKLLTSVCTYSSFPYGWTDRIKQRDFLLDLCSHVKNYETQTGGSFLPALQSVFQSPDVWIIDLSQRKTSVLLEVLKLQTEKKPVELRGCSEEESEMMSFLQCLPYISQLRIHYKNRGQAEQFLLKLFNKAAETETQTGEQMLKLLTSVCTYSSFPYEKTDRNKQRDFLLDLCSHVKKYETQTALQSVFQSPDVWIIDLSKRKTSVLLKALKLQTVKKPVELRGCLEEEREMMSLLHCLPYISQLRFSISVQNRFILKVFIKAAAFEKQTGKQMLKLLASVCTYSSFPYERTYRIKQRDLLLDLYSHVKNYETQTGRSFLPALQSVFQLPDVWIIDLSQRKTSVLLEVLKLQTEKKPVKLRGCSEEESEMSFLQCLPYISQLRIDNRNIRLAEQFVLKLFIKAAETEIQTGEQMLKLLTSVCTYSSFPYERTYRIKQSDFLLDLYSHVKNYETQTGRSFLPALQSVFQLPDDWIIDLSQRKTSVLLEVLKLQTEKKPVELRGCSEEESEVRSFLQCLPYISQLRFTNVSESVQKRFHLKLLIKAAETETQTGEQMLKLLTSVCAYRSFPYQWTDRIKQRDFLLDLCSHVKNYETQTGGSFLPALQSVFQSPKVWIIDLSQRKTSVLLEVLKLQTEKKPVELRGCSEEESEMKSFLQCLPHISQLSCSERCLLTLVKVVQLRENPDLVTLLLEVLDFSFSLEGSLSSKICRSVGRVLRSSADRLNLTLKPEAISIRGTRLLFRHITHIHTLRLSGYMVVRIVQALRSMRVQTPVTVNELTLDPNDNQLSERKWSRVLSSLAILLRLWTVQCLNLTEYKMESVSLSVLLCHQGPLILRSSKESLQKLVECVCEAQEEELTQHFLQKVGGDLTSCSLSWEELHYFLQHKIQQITVDFRKSNIQCKIREILPFLNRIQFKRLSSSFMLSIMREIYESGSAGFVSSLLSSVKNYISLQSRELDSVHCAALRFTLQHCTAVSLNLLWTSIPEEELESIVPLFRHVSSLSVDRRLLLKMLHCCSVSDVQQEAAAVLLSVLQHKLDFCRSALDLTTNTDSEPLHLTTEDCRVMSTVIQRAHTHTQLIMQDCVINTAGMDQLFPVLRSVKLCCDKSLLLQFLAHVRPEEAVSLSRALGDEVDLSQTHLEPQVCRGLVLILEYSEGLTELDLSQCRLTDHSLDLLLPNLHKAQNIDFSGNSITDIGAQRIYSIVSDNSNIKTVRLFNNRIEFRQLFLTDPRFEIW
ncbi:uncharacterized protein LOC127508489 isoform X9 [Ctenopharyngodon idella]|uniref:uncharacterized protein LOC127508489 isoform X9 n=1 Tax=Ctenopharyngodon idella TaxID=7959 RepID=UPI002231A8BE|nr:uncharacterized protein LOC127508489 isoform X9 [Ctenopharyngodon idella]